MKSRRSLTLSIKRLGADQIQKLAKNSGMVLIKEKNQFSLTYSMDNSNLEYHVKYAAKYPFHLTLSTC